MHALRTEIDIPAPPDHVWSVLTDLAAYPRWNPFIVEASGPIEVDGRLHVTVKPPGRRPRRFSPVITVVEPHQRLEWRGRFLVPGLVDGRHRFELSATGHGTHFVQSEDFTGLLVPLLARTLRDTEAGFELMNRALAARVTGR